MNQSTIQRLPGIDILRGLIIVLMALDHTRDFWSVAPFDPLDLSQTSPAWFFTRWVTHFCAPLFVFLTGISAFLYGRKINSKTQLRNYLVSRGVWLIFLEIVVINLSWQFAYQFVFVQVIWAIGWSMVILGGLIYLSNRWILAVTLPFLLLHNMVDDQSVIAALGDYKWLWQFLHMGAWIPLPEYKFGIAVAYPLLPWFSVMALGYVVGQWYNEDDETRQKKFMLLGGAMIAAFVVLRGFNIYGDPSQWQVQESFMFSLMSFINTAKYPASLLFLLMILGPGLILLALLDRVTAQGKAYLWLKWLKTYGSVPLFFYVIHVPVINGAAHIYTYFVYGKAVNFFWGQSVWPEGYEPNLMLTYIAWGLIVAALYLPCKYYGELKRRSNSLVLSYL